MMSERTVFVVNAGVDAGSALSRGLLSRGHRVALIADGDCEPPPGAETVNCDFGSRAALEQAFMEAAARCGPPAQVVASVLPLAAVQACATHEMSLLHWHAACRDAIKGLLYTLQAAFLHLGERGGSVVAVGPALSLPGAERLLALSAAAEGQRGLVKSTARQWGRRGLTVNWVAAAPRALSPLFDALPLPVKPDAVMVARGRGPSLDDGLAGVIDFLGSPAGRALTGVTLMADGGEWMVP
jgi:3-oxoacyl-[acyl-carrier protein] reductase